MRSLLGFAVLFLSLASWNVAFSQNELRGGGQPAGAAPGGTPAGAEEAPAGQFAPAQPGAGAANPGAPAGAPGGAPGGAQPGAANDPAFKAQVSYALGRNFAMNLKEGHIDVDTQSLMAGVNDTLSGAPPKFTEQQLMAALQRFGREMQMRMQQVAAKNQQEQAKFLAENGKREGVQTLPSGLQYRVVQQGQGAAPAMNDTVKCNYRGTLLNGTEFDSSALQGGPAEFKVKGGTNGLISGWVEALLKMHVGDKWQLFVPSNLAYGMNPPGDPIEPGSMLVFEIELLDVAKQPPTQ